MALQDPKKDIRPWGEELWLTQVGAAASMVKIISVKAGEALSLQFHKQRTEDWYIVSGDGTAEIAGKKIPLKAGVHCHVPREAQHRITAGMSDLMFVEVARGPFDEEDIVRLEDRYGRV